MSDELPVPETGFNYIRKSFRGLSYLAFIIGSGFGLFFPSTTITDVASRNVSIAWSLFFLISSIVCFAAVLMRNWVVEYFGLPLLAAVFYVLGVCLLVATESHTYNFVMFSLISFGVGIHLTSRFFELRHYINNK